MDAWLWAVLIVGCSGLAGVAILVAALIWWPKLRKPHGRELEWLGDDEVQDDNGPSVAMFQCRDCKQIIQTPDPETVRRVLAAMAELPKTTGKPGLLCPQCYSRVTGADFIPIPPSYVCPRCGARSFNANDIALRYCGRCHRFEDVP